jgi:hypothetical protein
MGNGAGFTGSSNLSRRARHQGRARGAIPSFIRITDGKTHEVNLLDDSPIEPGAFL